MSIERGKRDIDGTLWRHRSGLLGLKGLDARRPGITTHRPHILQRVYACVSPC